MDEGKKHVLQWHITHACNLRCKHCYQDDFSSHINEREFLSALDKYEQFISQRGYWAQINLTGGEPLLHPDFFAFAREIKKRGFRLGILTNGTLVDDGIAQRLQALSPVFVQVSLDGSQKKHDLIRGDGAFAQALSGIDALKRRHIKVLVSFTAQKSNYMDYEALARICRRHRVDKLWWDRVVTYSEKDTKDLALSTEEFRNLVFVCNALKKKYRFHKGFISNQRALQFLGTNDCGYRCAAGKQLLIFLADGSVMPCRRLPFVVGNIHESTVAEIISQSDIMKELAHLHVPQKCSICREFSRCYGGARCVTYAQTGSYRAEDVNCFI